MTSAPKTPQPVRAAVVTMNQHESAAVADALVNASWSSGPVKSDALGRVGYRITPWQSPDGAAVIDHLDMDNSGNLPAAMLATKHFRGTTVDYDMILVFGCAGLNPMQSAATGLSLGSVVVVEAAQYAENGRVRLEERPEHPGRIERVLIKGDRFKTFSVELSSGLTQLLARTLQLPKVKALCVDKVLQVDPHNGPTQPEPPFMEFGYTDLLQQGVYHIVDMESFGFLWALGDLTRNTAVIRVLTDELTTHAASTSGRSGQPSQQQMLHDSAGVLIEAVSAHPRIPRGPTAPPASGADAYEAVLQALLDSVSLSVLASVSSRTAVSRFLKWISLARPSRLDVSSRGVEQQLAEWFRQLDLTSDFGYGTQSLGVLTRDVSEIAGDELGRLIREREDRRSPNAPDEIESLQLSDYRKHVDDFLDRLAKDVDPTTSVSRYVTDLRTAVRALGVERDITVTDDSNRHLPAVARLSRSFQRDGRVMFVSSSGDRVASTDDPTAIWRGWEDDETLSVEIARFLRNTRQPG